MHQFVEPLPSFGGTIFLHHVYLAILLQGLQQAVIYGGCNICTGKDQQEDPSGSDSTQLLQLDLSTLTHVIDEPSALWVADETHGFNALPPRKGHGLVAVGCDLQHNGQSSIVEADDQEHDMEEEHASSCALYVFGGWNPRWPEGYTGNQALRKLSLETGSWSMVPTDSELVCF
jgi:hypothetical protein